MLAEMGAVQQASMLSLKDGVANESAAIAGNRSGVKTEGRIFIPRAVQSNLGRGNLERSQGREMSRCCLTGQSGRESEGSYAEASKAG